jgi:hypothetical protein
MEWLWINLLAALITGLVAPWVPRQHPPVVSQDGLRWTVRHAGAPGVLVRWTAGLAASACLIAAIGLLGAGWPFQEAFRAASVLFFVPCALVPLASAPYWWTRLEADPTGVRLVRSWPFRARRWRWSEVVDVRFEEHGLLLDAGGELVRLETRYGAEPEVVRDVVAALRATRASCAELESRPTEAEPAALRALRSAGHARLSRE